MSVRIDQAQAAILDWMKAQTTITNELPSSDNIKEREWQGAVFNYPAVRLDMGILEAPPECDYREGDFSILVFSEKDSSLEANRIAGIIGEYMHEKSFTRTTSQGTLHFSMVRLLTKIPALRQDRRTWRAEVLMNYIVQNG